MGVSSPTHHSTHSNLQPASTTWMNLLKLSQTCFKFRRYFWILIITKVWAVFDKVNHFFKYLKYDFYNSLFSWFVNFLTTEMNTGFNQGSVSNNSLSFLLCSTYQVNLMYFHSIMLANNPKINTFISKLFLDFRTQQNNI